TVLDPNLVTPDRVGSVGLRERPAVYAQPGHGWHTVDATHPETPCNRCVPQAAIVLLKGQTEFRHDRPVTGFQANERRRIWPEDLGAIRSVGFDDQISAAEDGIVFLTLNSHASISHEPVRDPQTELPVSGELHVVGLHGIEVVGWPPLLDTDRNVV